MAQIGLALSGGGFRATLYHLGVIRFLRDSGRLKDVSDVASVSGGSVVAAHLVINWDKYNGTDETFDAAAAEVVRFVQFDVRNRIVRRLPFLFVLRLFARLARRPLNRLTPNAILEKYYRDLLYGDRCLFELPEEPRLHILATNVRNGGLSVFNRDGLYLQQRKKRSSQGFEHIPGRMASIPRVVGASSAFPGFFPPVEVTAADLGVREGQFATESFTDGGVFDNLGIRTFEWLNNHGSDFESVLVSDAGKPFQILTESSLGLVGQSVRASDILWDRVWQLERENFGRRKGFVFLPITSEVQDAEHATLHPVIQAEVQSIRTDLDRFSDLEVNALAQHGYEVAQQQLSNEPDADYSVPADSSWAPIPEEKLPAQTKATSTDGLPSEVVTSARNLRHSSVRRVWSTLFDYRDWPSYVYMAVAVLILGILPFQVFELWERSQTQGMVIEAIASGDPDIRRVLDLITSDPSEGWQSDAVIEIDAPTETDLEGVEFLTHSRIIDLRTWDPENADPSKRGIVYVHDRATIILNENYSGDRHIVLAVPVTIDEVEISQAKSSRKAIVQRLSEPIIENGLEKTLYELEYDLSDVPLHTPVDVQFELIAKVPESTGRTMFQTRVETDLVSVWMLFPEERPYQKYDLVQYTKDRASAPVLMNSRYEINHPYGSLIGWSVVKPTVGNIYECRWTNL